MKKDRICITICSREWSKNILKILNDLNKNINKKKLNISFILVFNHQYKIKRFRRGLSNKKRKYLLQINRLSLQIYNK